MSEPTPTPRTRGQLASELLRDGVRVIAIRRHSITLLRFTCSVHTLRLEEANRSYLLKLKNLKLSWLAYAIFHPATGASSWRKLVVANCILASDVDSRRKLLSVTNLALLTFERLEKKRKRDTGSSSAAASTCHLQERLDHSKESWRRRWSTCGRARGGRA